MSENHSKSKFQTSLKKLESFLLNILNTSMNYWDSELTKNPNKKKEEINESNLNKIHYHFYVMQNGDLEKVQILRENLKNLSNQKLIESYNKIKPVEENHSQSLSFIALHQEFYVRFDTSPFEIEGSHLIILKGKIKYLDSENTFTFLDEN